MDHRHCDGPNCDQIKPVDDPFLDSWITLDRGQRYDFVGGRDSERTLHFHNQACLLDWAKENTRNV